MKLKLILILSLFSLLFPKPAHAYLDPGAGSYVLQIIAAVFFTALFLFKSWWGKLKALLLKIFSKKSEEPDDKTKVESN